MNRPFGHRQRSNLFPVSTHGDHDDEEYYDNNDDDDNDIDNNFVERFMVFLCISLY